VRTILFTLAIVAAGSAAAQLLPAATDPVLRADPPTTLRSLQPYAPFHARAEGLPPADPNAVESYRADLKLTAGFNVNPNFSLEATFVNPLYQDGLRYIGPGPRLAQGVPLGYSGSNPGLGMPRGVGGYDLDLVAKLAVPIDRRLSAFGKLGVATSERRLRDNTTTEFGTAASVGATYQLTNGQTITAEVPLGAMARKAMTGAADGYGARIKLGF